MYPAVARTARARSTIASGAFEGFALGTRPTRSLSQTVASDPSYRFIVSPHMQGDDQASPVEIDRTDFLALRAAASLLAAACHVAVSYELGFSSYDSTALVQALTRGSGWLALRSGGTAHMRSAGEALLASVDDLDRDASG